MEPMGLNLYRNLRYIWSYLKMSLTRVLNKAGLAVVNKDEIDRLKELVDVLYVDNRRTRQVVTLDEVREITRKL